MKNFRYLKFIEPKKMKHPDPKCQQRQEDFLKECPENEKGFHQTLFRVGNAAYIYYQQAGQVNDKISEEYFYEWLEGLSENIRKDMENKGFEACKTMVPFIRYVNERTDIGMDQWMKNHLSQEDYDFWIGSQE